MFKIATWNVNSLKVRLPQVLTWLQQHQPDVLALQETKVTDANFPLADIVAAGYQVSFSGQPTYNGVAILSRLTPQEVARDIPHFNDSQKRFLAVTVANVRVINLYVPNGESVLSEKFQYKLNWLAQLKNYLAMQVQQYDKLIVLGDFNIAPEAIDVYDPNVWEGQVLFSAQERAVFQELLNLKLVDSFRHLNPNQTSYTWWDYRAAAFQRDRGLRIDHILLSHGLTPVSTRCYIDKEARRVERPSDHAPVIVELNIPKVF